VREIGSAIACADQAPPLAYIQRAGQSAAAGGIGARVFHTHRAVFADAPLHVPGKCALGAELFVLHGARMSDESIGEFMRRRFGREATTISPSHCSPAFTPETSIDCRSARCPAIRRGEKKHGSLLRAFRRGPTGPCRRIARSKSLPGGLIEMINDCP